MTNKAIMVNRVESWSNKDKTDVYKGIAIVMILIAHTMGRFGKGIVLFTPFGGIGVAIFLILSGFGMHSSWIRNTNIDRYDKCYWRKRIVSVWIPYTIFELLTYWPFHKFDVALFVLDILLIKPLYYNGWFLQYIALWYIVFYVIQRIGIAIDLSDDCCFLLLAFVSILLFITQREIKAEQSLSFFMGALLSYKYNKSHVIFNIKAGSLLVIFGTCSLAIKQLPFIRESSPIILKCIQLCIKLPIALGVISLTYVLMVRLKLSLKVLAVIGMISFEIYLLHWNILQRVEISYIGAIEFVLASFGAALLFWWTMERIKPIASRVLKIDQR